MRKHCGCEGLSSLICFTGKLKEKRGGGLPFTKQLQCHACQNPSTSPAAFLQTTQCLIKSPAGASLGFLSFTKHEREKIMKSIKGKASLPDLRFWLLPLLADPSTPYTFPAQGYMKALGVSVYSILLFFSLLNINNEKIEL